MDDRINRAMTRRTPANVICENRRARFEYELLETYEAGLALQGWEIKSIRDKKAQLNHAYIKPVRNELFLLGAQITPLPNTDRREEKDGMRTRKLLMHRSEINKICSALQEKGLACVPLNLKWKKQQVKCALALGRGKKLYDKRQALKERDLIRAYGRKLKL